MNKTPNMDKLVEALKSWDNIICEARREDVQRLVADMEAQGLAVSLRDGSNFPEAEKITDPFRESRAMTVVFGTEEDYQRLQKLPELNNALVGCIGRQTPFYICISVGNPPQPIAPTLPLKNIQLGLH
jgi:hypothetical protein